MAHNSLIGLVTGLFSSKAQSVSSVSAYRDSEPAENNSGLTGVARYLECKKGKSSVTGVSKYLKKQEQAPISGVSKYVLRQSIAEKLNKSTVSSTGVEKYLKSRKDIAPVKISGVSRYINNMDKTPVSRVTKYLVNKSLADKNKPVQKTTRVAEYLENKKEHVTSGVSRYLTRQKLAQKCAMAEVNEVVKVLTGVEKYLQSHA